MLNCFDVPYTWRDLSQRCGCFVGRHLLNLIFDGLGGKGEGEGVMSDGRGGCESQCGISLRLMTLWNVDLGLERDKKLIRWDRLSF